jgi:imidazolonepropionase-like amidohydrolase
MNKLLGFIFCLFAFSPIDSQSVLSLPLSSGALVIKEVTIISPKTKKIIPGQTVIITGGKINKIGRTGQLSIPSDAQVIDGKGKFLVPGIAEMHAHIPVPDSSNDLTSLSQTLFLYLSNGVTTLRGMLGQPFHLKLNETLAARSMNNIPRIYTSSPSFNGNSVPDIATAEKLVRQYKAEGYHFLKIHPGIKKDVYDGLARTAKEAGIPFAGHIPVEVGVTHAIESGQLTIDHVDGYIEALAPPLADLTQNGFFGFNLTDKVDMGKLKKLIDLTKQKGTWIVPTQSLFTRWFSPTDPNLMMQETELGYMPSRTRFAWTQSKTNLIRNPEYSEAKFNRFLDIRKKILYAMHQSNVNLLLGSDAPQVMNVPGFSLQHEMISWSDAGIPNWKILQASSSEVARFFKAENQFGDIAAGLSADLILLDKNPIDDIKNMQAISGVINKGIWMSKAQIDSELDKIRQANQ